MYIRSLWIIFFNLVFKDLFWGFLPLIDRTVKVWTGNEMERRGGKWDREMTAGRIRTRVPVGAQARTWSGLLLAPQCPPRLVILIVKYGEGDCREIKSLAKFNTG